MKIVKEFRDRCSEEQLTKIQQEVKMLKMHKNIDRRDRQETPDAW